MPDVITWKVMPLCSCHLVRLPKNAVFAPKKSVIGPKYLNLARPRLDGSKEIWDKKSRSDGTIEISAPDNRIMGIFRISVS
jgi:hypothetical protein